MTDPQANPHEALFLPPDLVDDDAAALLRTMAERASANAMDEWRRQDHLAFPENQKPAKKLASIVVKPWDAAPPQQPCANSRSEIDQQQIAEALARLLLAAREVSALL
jgi:hypothetical protein